MQLRGRCEKGSAGKCRVHSEGPLPFGCHCCLTVDLRLPVQGAWNGSDALMGATDPSQLHPLREHPITLVMLDSERLNVLPEITQQSPVPTARLATLSQAKPLTTSSQAEPLTTPN